MLERKPVQSATETRILDKDMADEFLEIAKKGMATARQMGNGQIAITAPKEEWDRWNTA